MKYYIGIDLGGTNIVAGVVNEAYEILAKARPVKSADGTQTHRVLQTAKLVSSNIPTIWALSTLRW